MKVSGNLQSNQTIFEMKENEDLLLNSFNEINNSTNIRINSPSETIHISNLSSKTCNEVTLSIFFQRFGKIKNIQLFLNLFKRFVK